MLKLFHKMGLFQKLFAGKEAQFQSRVVSILKDRYPSESAQASPDSKKVSLNGIEFDIASLASVSDDVVYQYCSHLVALVHRADRISWTDAKSVVRPQLFPAEHRDKVPVLSFPLTNSIAVGIVFKSTFIYKENISNWQISADEILRQSIENLAEDAVETEVTVSGSDRFIGLETHDGFDAARILMPKIRNLAAQKLGEPYWIGIPNQSFLILWAKDCSQRFQDYALEKVETDFSIQPFPLSKTPLDSAALR